MLHFSLVKGCTTFSMVSLEASRKMEAVVEICCEKNLVVNATEICCMNKNV